MAYTSIFDGLFDLMFLSDPFETEFIKNSIIAGRVSEEAGKQEELLRELSKAGKIREVRKILIDYPKKYPDITKQLKDEIAGYQKNSNLLFGTYTKYDFKKKEQALFSAKKAHQLHQLTQLKFKMAIMNEEPRKVVDTLMGEVAKVKTYLRKLN